MACYSAGVLTFHCRRYASHQADGIQATELSPYLCIACISVDQDFAKMFDQAQFTILESPLPLSTHVLAQNIFETSAQILKIAELASFTHFPS